MNMRITGRAKYLVCLVLMFMALAGVNGQVGINTSGGAPDPSAGLDVNFTDKGFLPPRMSLAQRNAIPAPAEGLTIFNTTTGCLNIRVAGTWKQVCPDCDFPNPEPGTSGPACEGGTVSLYASTIPGATYQWTGPGGYSSSSQNPQLSGITPAQSGAYSVTASLGGCTSSPQTTYVVVNPLPAAPAVGSNSPVCAGSAISLTASGGGGVSYSWSGPSGFSSSQQNPSVSNASAANAGTYSATVTQLSSGCTSAPASVNVVVNALPTILTTTPASRNGTGSVTLGATASAGSVLWYTQPTGGSQVHTGTSFTTPVLCATTTYYAEAVHNGCASATRTAVTATLNKIFQVDTGCSLTNGLVSYWRMEGNSTDFFGPNNGADVSMSYSPASGRVGQGAQFAGGPSKIVVSESSSLGLSTFSFGMWVRTTSNSGGYQVIARRSASFMQGYGLYFVPSTGKLGLYLGTGADHQVTTTKTINDGNWHFVMMTWDGTAQQGRVYCDNVLEGTLNVGAPLVQSGALNLGYDVPNSSTVYSFVGSMDQAGYWNRVLTAQELTDLYNAGAGQTMP